MWIVTHINTRYPRVAAVTISTIERTDFRIHTIILGQSKEILYLEIEAHLRESLPSDEFLEIITQGKILQANVITILQIEI